MNYHAREMSFLATAETGEVSALLVRPDHASHLLVLGHGASRSPLDGVSGIVFFSFSLHQPGKPDSKRASHLGVVTVPMLFLSGTRDELADLDLLRPVCKKLGKG